MLAGYARVNITPPLGQVPFAGYNGRKHLPRGVMTDDGGNRHELHARALVLCKDGDQGSPAKMACLVTTDLFMLRYYWVQEVRELATRLTGIPGERICIHATHSHQAPDTMGIYYPGHDFDGTYLDEAFLASLKRLIAGAIFGAWKDLKPCKVAVGEGVLEGFTMNRRDQALFANPPPNPRTIDPQVPAIAIYDAAGRAPRVIITGFATHPTFLNTFEEWAAEHVAFIDLEVKRRFGPRVETMYFTGQAGDVVPFQDLDERFQLVLNPGARPLKEHQAGIDIVKVDPDGNEHEIKDIERVAAGVGTPVATIVDGLRADLGVEAAIAGGSLQVKGKTNARYIFTTVSKLGHAVRSSRKATLFATTFVDELERVVRGLEPADSNDLAMGREVVNVEIDDEDMVEQYRVLLDKANPRKEGSTFIVDSEVQGIKIAGAYIACLPSEPVNEIGMRLKALVRETGIQHVFLFQMCNDGFGYVVPHFEHDAKGYEVSIFCFGRENGAILERAAARVASRLTGARMEIRDVPLPEHRQAEWPPELRRERDAWLAGRAGPS